MSLFEVWTETYPLQSMTNCFCFGKMSKHQCSGSVIKCGYLLSKQILYVPICSFFVNKKTHNCLKNNKAKHKTINCLVSTKGEKINHNIDSNDKNTDIGLILDTVGVATVDHLALSHPIPSPCSVIPTICMSSFSISLNQLRGLPLFLLPDSVYSTSFVQYAHHPSSAYVLTISTLHL